MKSFIKINRVFFLSATVIFSFIMTSCNKEVEQLGDIPVQTNNGQTLEQVIRNNADYSLYYTLIQRGGQVGLINDLNRSYTMFVPNNDAMKSFISARSGGLLPTFLPLSVFVQVINTAFTPDQAAALVLYHTMPQTIASGTVPNKFPNFYYPSAFNPVPGLSSLFRIDVYPSTRNGFWFNNISTVSGKTDVSVGNGVIHEITAVGIPPQHFLWDRINSDTSMSIFKAAVNRADSGTSALTGAFQNIGANFTVFIPTNNAMKQTISALTRGLIPVAAPDQVFIGFLNSNNISTFLAKGLVAYHIFDGRSETNKPTLSVERPGRAFLNNFPTTAQWYKTLLNYDSSVATLHPGVSISATVSGNNVTAARVKGLYNATAANVLINSTDSTGTSDQQYLNGIIHRIDQVLLPTQLQ